MFVQLEHSCLSFRDVDGGAKEDRTPDLLRAKQALSQLSYSPIVVKISSTLISVEARRGDTKHT